MNEACQFNENKLRSTWHIILSANVAIAYSATKNQEYDTHLLTKNDHQLFYRQKLES